MSAPAPDAPRLRRTWPQRLLIGACVGLIVACVTGAGGIGYAWIQFGRVDRVDPGNGVLSDSQPPGDPENFLLVGSDSRAFVEGGQDEASFGRLAGQHSDTIMLVRIDPRAKHAWMLSFPRDLWLPIAPDGHHERINTAYASGDPQRLIDTIKANFNVPIHHYAEIDFPGFRTLVNTVGGVKVYLASPVRDFDRAAQRNNTGLEILDTGCVQLNGDQALAYVRSRHLQYLENGRWVDDPTSDFGRIARQQDFVRRALGEALSRDLFNPKRLNGLVNVAVDNITIDNELDLKDILRLGRTFKSLDPAAVTQFSLPVINVKKPSGALVLEMQAKDQPAIDDILRVFRSAPEVTAPASEPIAPLTPAGVTARVMNGSGVNGQALAATSALRQSGFSVQAPGTTAVIARTTIRYSPGQRAKAELLARYLVTGAELVESSSLGAVDLVVVTGRDFQGVLATPDPAPPSTTTTSTTIPSTPLAAPEC